MLIESRSPKSSKLNPESESSLSTPRCLGLVRFDFGAVPPEYHAKHPFIEGRTYIFFGEFPNMPGHCVVADHKTGLWQSLCLVIAARSNPDTLLLFLVAPQILFFSPDWSSEQEWNSGFFYAGGMVRSQSPTTLGAVECLVLGFSKYIARNPRKAQLNSSLVSTFAIRKS
jgi:hypothetical protein